MTANQTLQKYRIRKGLNSAEAAKLLDISPQHLSRIENGKSVPSPLLLERMIQHYKVETSDGAALKRQLWPAIDEGQQRTQGLSHEPDGMPTVEDEVNVDAATTPVHYVNAVYISSDPFGIVIDGGTRIAATNKVQIVARMGLSHAHAIQVRKILDLHIKKLEEMGESLKQPPK